MKTMNDTSKTSLTLSLDWRFVSAALLFIILVMLGLWRPWLAGAAANTISVRGEATVKAAPDSFQFQPVFQDEDVKKVTATGNEAVVQLKKLGVKDADIKTSVSAAPNATNPEKPTDSSSSRPPDYYYSQSSYVITATVYDKAVAQKIADYLATSGAGGQITPMSSFSKETRAKLDLEARSKASKDAKQKAEAMAKELGLKVGKVVKISEEGGYGIYALDARESIAPSKGSVSSGPTIEPGTDEVNYVFTVVFELK